MSLLLCRNEPTGELDVPSVHVLLARIRAV
jgi:hypothetical protein